jgi:hypothetical protein
MRITLAAYSEKNIMRMNELGKTLMIAGLVLAAMGAVIWSGIGRNWLGKLPGDISVNRGNMSFYFPVATCLLFSVVLSLLLWLFRR